MILISNGKALGSRLLQSDISHWFARTESTDVRAYLRTDNHVKNLRTDNHVATKTFLALWVTNFVLNYLTLFCRFFWQETWNINYASCYFYTYSVVFFASKSPLELRHNWSSTNVLFCPESMLEIWYIERDLFPIPPHFQETTRSMQTTPLRNFHLKSVNPLIMPIS